jgi:DNA ligase (NAD+)
MNIDGIGAETIELLVQKGLVHNIADLYDLKFDQLLNLERFAEKSAQNVIKGIEQSKQAPFRQVLFALGIRHVGATTAEKLANHFGNIKAIKSANVEELTKTPEVGEKIAYSILHYFADDENNLVLERLMAAGLKFENEEGPALESDKLHGKSFVVSGVFQHFSREEITQKILANGGKVLSGVSAKLDFLVAGENMGPSKLEKATKLGVKMISEAEFIEMLA